MGHDANKVLLGSHGSSDLEATCFDSDPASFPAARAVRRKSDGKLSLASADGQLVGVSLGIDLADTKKTSVARVGNRVPLQVGVNLLKGSLTFIKKRNVDVAIEFLDTETAGAETVTVTGDDDAGYLISVGMETTVTTATQAKAALDGDAEALALIETVITAGAGATAQAAFAEDDIDGVAHVVIGAAVTVSNVNGVGVPAAKGTLTGASYVSEPLDGIDPILGTATCKVAYIDMGGGL